jgi:hypothetical protein
MKNLRKRREEHIFGESEDDSWKFETNIDEEEMDDQTEREEIFHHALEKLERMVGLKEIKQENHPFS